MIYQGKLMLIIAVYTINKISTMRIINSGLIMNVFMLFIDYIYQSNNLFSIIYVSKIIIGIYFEFS